LLLAALFFVPPVEQTLSVARALSVERTLPVAQTLSVARIAHFARISHVGQISRVVRVCLAPASASLKPADRDAPAYPGAWGFAAHAFAVRDPAPIFAVRAYPARDFAVALVVEISVRGFAVRAYPARDFAVRDYLVRAFAIRDFAAAPVVKIPARD